uniref:Uncharacterized protein n=1 Tax=Lepeophtheirus salmonis TaxID=72036 RepID=A0A0K2V516_LEPSM
MNEAFSLVSPLFLASFSCSNF